MEAGTLLFCATADAITLYWDKPAGAAAPCRYEVRLAGPVNQLRLEHCAGVTFKDLCCDEEI